MQVHKNTKKKKNSLGRKGVKSYQRKQNIIFKRANIILFLYKGKNATAGLRE